MMENKKLFAKDARVAFYGDSITHHGVAHAYIQDYYREHLPERKVKIYNCGIGGDSTWGALERYDYVMKSCEPTEVVVALGCNDLHVDAYENTEGDAAQARIREIEKRHTDSMVKLCDKLHAEGLPITYCSGNGRDFATENAEPSHKNLTRAAERIFEADIAAIGYFKNVVDYITPYQRMMRELVAAGLQSPTNADRVHPRPLGQQLMARIFLAAQGLPVVLPTAEDYLNGFCERSLPKDILDVYELGALLNDIAFVYPHQKNRCDDPDLNVRIAFWAEENKKLSPDDYFYKMNDYYIHNAAREDDMRKEYLQKIDDLYR